MSFDKKGFYILGIFIIFYDQKSGILEDFQEHHTSFTVYIAWYVFLNGIPSNYWLNVNNKQ